MKKISYYLSFLLLCLATTFISCDDEQLEGEFFTTPDGQVITTNTEECLAASLALQEAYELFLNAPPEQIITACAAVSDALDAYILACDTDINDPAISVIVSGFSDCNDSSNNCDTATTAAIAAQTAFANASPENEVQLCNAYRTALETQLAVCGDADGSIQATINGLSCVDAACADAITASEEALAIFDMVDVTDADAYTEACGNYSFALQEQIVACGDENGSLQAIIDELGDCSPPEDDGPVRMTIDGDFKNFNVAEAPINGSTFEVTATDVDVNDTFQFNVVLQQTGENILQSVVLTIDGVSYTPVLNGETQFSSNITENDGMVIIGTFTGPMMNADGEIITITNGIIDIEV
ncbi:hypothetical protein ACFO3O_10535 [Dokdonia ponticola]|uniref:Uncharacterized protein n=1 Tax=Dokdonia ponticola TaxID=2041041 RepID=A0ABV9HY07_9FLAO